MRSTGRTAVTRCQRREVSHARRLRDVRVMRSPLLVLVAVMGCAGEDGASPVAYRLYVYGNEPAERPTVATPPTVYIDGEARTELELQYASPEEAMADAHLVELRQPALREPRDLDDPVREPPRLRADRPAARRRDVHADRVGERRLRRLRHRPRVPRRHVRCGARGVHRRLHPGARARAAALSVTPMSGMFRRRATARC